MANVQEPPPDYIIVEKNELHAHLVELCTDVSRRIIRRYFIRIVLISVLLGETVGYVVFSLVHWLRQ